MNFNELVAKHLTEVQSSDAARRLVRTLDAQKIDALFLASCELAARVEKLEADASRASDAIRGMHER